MNDLFKNIKFISEVNLIYVSFDSETFLSIIKGHRSELIKVYIIPTEPFGFIVINQNIYWFSYFMDDYIVIILSLKNFDNILEKINSDISKEFLFHLNIFNNSISLDSIGS